MKTLVLSNGYFSLPIIQTLQRNNVLSAVGITDEYLEGPAQLKVVCSQLGLRVDVLLKENFAEELENSIQLNGVTLVIVCGFPWKIPKAIINLPEVDFLNVHLAKLPEYKGPSPIFWQIKNREPNGAACLHMLTDEFDSGPILSMKPVPIHPMETFGLHTIQAAVKAAEMIQNLMLELKSGNWKYRVKDQIQGNAKYYSRPSKLDLLIDWKEMGAADVVALIKASNPWNRGAFTSFGGSQIRFADARIVPFNGEVDFLPGTIVKIDLDEGLFVVCKDKSVIKIEVVTLEEGFFFGGILTQLGAKVGQRFDSEHLLKMSNYSNT